MPEIVSVKEVIAVEEVVTVKENKIVEMEQKMEVAKQITAMLDSILLRKSGILPTFAQNRHQYQKMTISVANLQEL